MSSWPVWYSSSQASQIAQKEAQRMQKIKDEAEVKKRMHAASGNVKCAVQWLIDKNK